MKHEGDLDRDEELDESDEELQQAFQSGKLKPGINVVKERVVKNAVNNEKLILQKLEEIRLRLPWLERLDLSCSPATMAPQLRQQLEVSEGRSAGDASNHKPPAVSSQLPDSEDDFRRETLFYRIAQAGVLEGLPRLHELGVKTKRPADYLAQMVKSDEQMDRVRKFLLQQKTRKEMSEKARKMRAMRKLSKQTQVQAEQRKAREKRDMLEQVKKVRKGQQKSLDFLDDLKNNNRKLQGKTKTKREQKDKRFGHGGKKRGQKRNTASSAADMRWAGAGSGLGGAGGTSARAAPRHGSSGKKAARAHKKSVKQKRPGKMARQARKNKRK